nr:nucleotidyltransferase family protein [Pseudoxanthomonas helianthi]
MIFAAGLGERMRPLTNTTPKPLLPAGGKPLIAWHLEKLAAIGVREVVVNTSWLAEQFPQTLGDGAAWGLRIAYSYEGPHPLETGGGMLNALPSLGDDAPFLLVNGDVWTDYDFARLPAEPAGLAHLVMVDPPEFAPRGDFHLSSAGLVTSDGEPRLTYAGIGVYRPAILQGWREHTTVASADETPPRFPLAPILRAHMPSGAITGERHDGRWTDVGTPQRLAELDAVLVSSGVL